MNETTFVWGRLSAPYDGCFHKNVIVFTGEKYSYITEDLKNTSYENYFVDDPEDDEKWDFKGFSLGRVLTEDLPEILSRMETYPLSMLEPNTPYMLTRAVLAMAEEFYDEETFNEVSLFTCARCEEELYSENVRFLESEFRGNGGIGIESGAPICDCCYYNSCCAYCGVDGFEEEDLDNEGYCTYCQEDHKQ